MAGAESIQSQNLKLTNWLYGVQPDAPEITMGDKLSATGNEFLMGTAGILALPLAGNLFRQPWQAFQGMDRANGVSYLDAWKKLSEQAKANSAALKGENFWQSYRNRSLYRQITGMSSEIPAYDPSKLPSGKMSAKQIQKNWSMRLKNRCYADAKRLIEETKQMLEDAKKSGKTLTKAQLKEQLGKVREAIRQGDIEVNKAIQEGRIKPTSRFGRLKHNLKLKTGGYKLEAKMLSSVRGAGALKCASKCVKGSGWMALIQGVLEIPDIISAYQIDKQEEAAGRESNRGNKQLAKSAVKVGSSVLGYAAGAAATGAIVGSVFPGIGNVAGAVIGFVGGLIGGFVASWAAGKATDAITGEKDSLDKSEVQIYEEEQNDALAEESNKIAIEAGANLENQTNLLATIEKQIEEGNIPPDEVLAAYQYVLEDNNERIDKIAKYKDAINILAGISGIGSTSYNTSPFTTWGQYW